MATRPSAAVDKGRSDALAQLNLTKIVRAYIAQMIDEVPGYKAVLLDKDTMRICSTLYGRTELAEHNVVHVETVENNEGKDHMELKVSKEPLIGLCLGCGMLTLTSSLPAGCVLPATYTGEHHVFEEGTEAAPVSVIPPM